jgi:inosine-uridine nucleoside N-ribohydrolase
MHDFDDYRNRFASAGGNQSIADGLNQQKHQRDVLSASMTGAISMHESLEAQAEFRTAQDATYPYRNVRQRYRTEELWIADSERAQIEQHLRRDAPQSPSSSPGKCTRFFIDTDIGTDVDDALALLFALQAPNSKSPLLGVCTVYGHTHVRAAVARAIVGIDERAERHQAFLPVHAGESMPLGSHFPVWHTGTEGEGVLTDQEIAALKRRSNFVVSNGCKPGPIADVETAREQGEHQAACWIVEQIHRFPKEITIVSIGALTNIAVALRLDPTIAPLIPRIVYMGTGSRLGTSPGAATDLPIGSPESPIDAGTKRAWIHYPNINLVADTLAAMEVFRSRIPIDVVGHDVTSQLWWGKASSHRQATRERSSAVQACEALRGARQPAPAAVVGKLLDVWLNYRSAMFRHPVNGTCPHDPLTVAEAMFPG